MEDKSRIIIRKTSQWLDRHEVYDFFVDDTKVGTIGRASPLYFIITPGVHKFQCKIKQFSSPEFELKIKPEEIIYLRTGKRHSQYLPAFFWFLTCVISFLVFKILGKSPQWLIIFQMASFGFYIIYSLYNLTLGRKKYLSLEKDKKTFFSIETWKG
jgi:hypothetical protein